MPSKEEHKDFYNNQLMELYTLSRGIVDSIEIEGMKNAVQKTEMITPIINQIEESVDFLSEQYLKFIDNGEKASAEEIRSMEDAFRKIFITIEQYAEKSKANLN